MFRSSYTCWWSIACIGLCMFVTQLFKIVSSCFRSVSIFLGLRGWSEWEVGHARPMLKISFHQPLVHWITLRNSVFPFLCEDFLRSLNIKKKTNIPNQAPSNWNEFDQKVLRSGAISCSMKGNMVCNFLSLGGCEFTLGISWVFLGCSICSCRIQVEWCFFYTRCHCKSWGRHERSR